ncbi:MAG TPA: hypothetical protein VLJ57_08635 [Burkholderiaceae bacterium]|nr:hypothetical protein [Burkholderiaceae bacterium]
MLTAANLVKLIAEIALLALLGQWVLGLFAGAKREQNLFYQILEIVGRPFVSAARFVTPRFVLPRHVPLVAFLILVFVWLGATIVRIQICLQIGVELCK